jgi:urocanate hydratase
MLQNNLDPEVAENPDALVVYGGIGKAARNWDCFEAILAEPARAEARRDAAGAERQAGGRVPHPCRRAARADRQLSNLVPKWATWEHFTSSTARA